MKKSGIVFVLCTVVKERGILLECVAVSWIETTKMFKVRTVLNPVSGLDRKISLASIYTPLSDYPLHFQALLHCHFQL